MEQMTRERVFDVRDRLFENCRKWIFGLEQTLSLLVNAQFMLVPYTDKITDTKLLGQAHLLLIGGTGRGKTDSLTSLSKSMRAKHNRIQGTPELKVSDILGGYDIMEDLEGKREVVFTPGDVFCNLLLVDENSRIPPKTISALIEAAEERSVTPPNKRVNLGSGVGYRQALPLYPISGDLTDDTGPRFFSVSLTQNPFGEEEGTYPTPQALWDRISLCIEIERPPFEEEMKISASNVVGKKIEPVTDLTEVLAAAQFIYDTMRFSKEARRYQNQVVRNTDPDITVVKDPVVLTDFVHSHVEKEKGASPRVHFHLEAAARVHAFFAGDDIVKPEHVKAVAPLVIAHRVKLVPKMRYKKDARSVFAEILEQTPMPRWKA
jgi:MoxR-like ATPase